MGQPLLGQQLFTIRYTRHNGPGRTLHNDMVFELFEVIKASILSA